MDNTNSKPADNKYDPSQIIIASVQINDSLYLLHRVDFGLVDKIIESTPDEFKKLDNYKILSLTSEYFKKVKESCQRQIGQDNEAEAEAESPIITP